MADGLKELGRAQEEERGWGRDGLEKDLVGLGNGLGNNGVGNGVRGGLTGLGNELKDGMYAVSAAIVAAAAINNIDKISNTFGWGRS